MGQFLNCVYGSPRIVLLTIQELSKAQCNNTDNNYTDYSDTDYSDTDYSDTDYSDTDLILSYPEWNRNDKM